MMKNALCQVFDKKIKEIMHRVAFAIANWLVTRLGLVLVAPEALAQPTAPHPDEMRFSRTLAQQVGIDGAVLYHKFAEWIAYNEKQHGTSVTYRSAKEWCEKEFPWLTARQFSARLKKLAESGLIGVTPGRGADRRLRISTTTNTTLMLPLGDMVLPNGQMGAPKPSNHTNTTKPNIQNQTPQANAPERKRDGAGRPQPAERNENLRGDGDNDLAATHAHNGKKEREAAPAVDVPADVRQFYRSCGSTWIQSQPLEALRWGMHCAQAPGVRNAVGLARRKAETWCGETPTVIDLPTPALTLPNVVPAHPAPDWYSLFTSQLQARLGRECPAVEFGTLADGVLTLSAVSEFAAREINGRLNREIVRVLRDFGVAECVRAEVAALATVAA